MPLLVLVEELKFLEVSLQAIPPFQQFGPQVCPVPVVTSVRVPRSTFHFPPSSVLVEPSARVRDGAGPGVLPETK